MALPTRTWVAPKRIASGKSALMPMDRNRNPLCAAILAVSDTDIATVVAHTTNPALPGEPFTRSNHKPTHYALANGETVHFTVTSVQEYPKAHFPASEVYGPEPYQALRLITCGGAFDEATGHYLSNIVAYARMN